MERCRPSSSHPFVHNHVPQLVILTIEGWNRHCVGGLGGALAKTPNLDALAARSLVCDQFWTHSGDDLDVLRRIIGEPTRWDRWMTDEASRWSLVTDSPELGESDLADVCDTIELVDLPAREVTAEELDETAIFQLIAAAITSYSAGEAEGGILWIHSRGLKGAWDAPHELRMTLCGEEDPVPNDSAIPPHAIDTFNDPDRIFEAQCGAAAQTIAIDAACGLLSDWLASMPSKSVFAVLGTSGYPLGEHGVVGVAGSNTILAAEEIHLPAIIHGGDPLGWRLPYCVQPQHISGLIDQAAGWSDRDNWTAFDPARWPDENRLAYCFDRRSDRQTVLTDRWYATRIGESPVQIFVHPEDSWQQNNVASRVEDVSLQTQVALEIIREQANSPVAGGGDELLARLRRVFNVE